MRDRRRRGRGRYSLGETAAVGKQPVMECRTVNTSLVSECMKRKAGGGVKCQGEESKGLEVDVLHLSSGTWTLQNDPLQQRSTSGCYITKPDETQ